MNWGELKELARAGTPYAKTTAVSDDIIEQLLYKGVVEVARRTKCLPKKIKFNLVAETSEYTLSTITNAFLVMDKPGVWWYDGTNYKQLDVKTKKWLDENIPSWRTLGSGTPLYYYQEANTIGFHPKPNTTQADGALLHYFAKPDKPDNDEKFAFEGTTEISSLLILEDCILNYYRWKVLPMLAQDDEYNRAENQYKRSLIDVATLLIKERPDISASRKTRYRGPRIGL